MPIFLVIIMNSVAALIVAVGLRPIPSVYRRISRARTATARALFVFGAVVYMLPFLGAFLALGAGHGEWSVPVIAIGLPVAHMCMWMQLRGIEFWEGVARSRVPSAREALHHIVRAGRTRNSGLEAADTRATTDLHELDGRHHRPWLGTSNRRCPIC